MTKSTGKSISTTRDGIHYHADLTETNGTCVETVSVVPLEGPKLPIHKATFPVKNLGEADWHEYLECLLATILGARKRADRLGITLKQALEGQVNRDPSSPHNPD